MLTKSERAEQQAKLRRLLHIEDWFHFQDLREIDSVGFSWWWNKYKPHLKQTAARRAWDRLLVWLRESNLKFDEVKDDQGYLCIQFTTRGRTWVKARIDAIGKYPNDPEKRKRYERWRRRHWAFKFNPKMDAKRRKRQQQFYSTPDQVEKRRRWQEENRDRIREQKRLKHKDDPFPTRERVKRWRSKNLAYTTKMKHDYYMTTKEKRIEAIVKHHGNQCCVCKQTFPWVVYDLETRTEKDREELAPKGVRNAILHIGHAKFAKLLPKIRIVCANCSRIEKARKK